MAEGGEERVPLMEHTDDKEEDNDGTFSFHPPPSPPSRAGRPLLTIKVRRLKCERGFTSSLAFLALLIRRLLSVELLQTKRLKEG